MEVQLLARSEGQSSMLTPRTHPEHVHSTERTTKKEAKWTITDPPLQNDVPRPQCRLDWIYVLGARSVVVIVAAAVVVDLR